jgi:hypothetical protein
MIAKTTDTHSPLRDGMETLPEPLDLPIQPVIPRPPVSDADLDEMLLETFPASDAPASGRTA